jgi:hypothetical protein
MSAKKNTEGLAFLVDVLKKDKKAVYADAKAAAEKKGLTVWPIMFGKAKLMLGYVKAGSGVTKKAATGPRRGPGRPPKSAMVVGPRRGPGRPRKVQPISGSIEAIVDAVKNGQRDLGRYRSALERIQSVLSSALA